MNFLEQFSQNIPDFLISLEIMAFGMVGIFLVLGLIFASVKILIKLFPATAEE
jgi:hypothetical protein